MDFVISYFHELVGAFDMAALLKIGGVLLVVGCVGYCIFAFLDS